MFSPYPQRDCNIEGERIKWVCMSFHNLNLCKRCQELWWAIEHKKEKLVGRMTGELVWVRKRQKNISSRPTVWVKIGRQEIAGNVWGTVNRRINWEIWLKGCVQNKGNLNCHAKEYEEQRPGKSLISSHILIFNHTKMNARSLQQNTVLEFQKNMHLFPTLNSDTGKYIAYQGNSVWEVKDPAGTSSRPGAHVIFWSWNPPNL